MSVPGALFIVDIGEEDASAALARHVSHINVEGKSTAKVRVVFVGPPGIIIIGDIIDKGSVIFANLDHRVLSLQILTLQTLHVELEVATPVLHIGHKALELMRLGLGLRRGLRVRSLLILTVRVDLKSPESPGSISAITTGI